MGDKIQFYTSWFCPFAQRAWIGLLYKGIEFNYHEVDPYNKSKEWLAINPKGLVPSFIYKGNAIYESGICLEFLEDAFPETKMIFPQDPYKRAQQRMWGDHICKKIHPPFYSLLIQSSSQARLEAANNLLEGLKYLFDQADSTGPFLAGADLQYADIMLAPFALRFKPILEYYRGFTIPNDWTCYHDWLKSIQSHPSITPTVADEQRLIVMYQRYADNTAVSEVADAIRKGTVLP